ncbi:isoprenoid synthase domain-containing protein [Xylariaceae sp. FL0804]|nr:isoprenoid synthase domain-containing protein [Xylariaceae sp. FL0804]
MGPSAVDGTRGVPNPKLGAVFTRLVRELRYQEPRHDDTRPALEAAMIEYAASSGAPYESEYAQRYFDVGLTLACAYYPSHPFSVKLHIAIYSWLAIYIDDDEDGTEDLAGFQTRFQKGEPQPSALLTRFAEVLQAMSMHFEPIVTNFIVLSSLQFVNATLLERRSEFHCLQHCREASGWPDYIRDRSGVPEAYAYFIFPREQCPDIGAYMQGIPDMMTYIDHVNDVLSFHKESLAGETDNYINTRADCEQREPLAVLQTVVDETILANSRLLGLLRTRPDPVYARKWNEFFNGYIFFHVTARRYELHVYTGLVHEGLSGRE